MRRQTSLPDQFWTFEENLADGKSDAVVGSQKRALVDLVPRCRWDFMPVFLIQSAHQDFTPVELMDEGTRTDVACQQGWDKKGVGAKTRSSA